MNSSLIRFFLDALPCRFGLAIIATLLICGHAVAAPFTNGSFEQPGVSGFTALPTNSTFINSWLVEAGNGVVYEENEATHDLEPLDGQFAVSFGHNGAHGDVISQTFTTVPGAVYVVNYGITQIQFTGDDDQSMQVEAFDGATSLAPAVSNLIPHTPNQWAQGTAYVFTASSTSTRLVFSDTTPGASGGSANWALDAVTVAQPTPDRLVLYTRNPSGDRELVLMDPDGSRKTTLIDGALNTQFSEDFSVLKCALSADGKAAAFSDFDNGLYVMKAEPLSATNVPVNVLAGASVTHSFSSRMSWSPNGRFLAFQGSDSHLYVIQARDAGGTITPFHATTNPLIDVFTSSASEPNPVWSPDGKHLAIAEGSSILAFPITNGAGTITPATMGSTVSLTSVGNFNEKSSVAWSSDGRKIAYVETKFSPGTQSQILLLNARDAAGTLTPQSGGNAPVPLYDFTNAPLAETVSWSADGALLVVSEQSGGQTNIHAILPALVDAANPRMPLTTLASGGGRAAVFAQGLALPVPDFTLDSDIDTQLPYSSSNPWTFKARLVPPLPSSTTVRVQSSTTPGTEASWTDVPGGAMDNNGSDPGIGTAQTWVATTSQVPNPVGLHFRVVAAATGRVDTVSVVRGPFPPAAPLPTPDFSLDSDIASVQPFTSYKEWTFKARLTQPPALPAGTTMRVQASTDAGATWTDVPGGAMSNRIPSDPAQPDPPTRQTWVATTKKVPSGTNVRFRVIASAPGAEDKISVERFPFDITPPPLVAPATEFSILIDGKKNKTAGKQGDDFKFVVRQQTDFLAPELKVRVQFSTTPTVESSWQDLPESALSRSTGTSLTWVLTTLRIPSGATVFFRTVTSALDHADGIGAVSGPYHITAAPIVTFDITWESDSDPINPNDPNDASGETVHVGETITYHFTVHNYGDAAVQEARIKMDIPALTKFEGATHRDNPPGYFEPAGASSMTRKIAYNVGTLAPGAMVQEAVLCEVSDDADPGDTISSKNASIQGLNISSVVANLTKTTVLGPLELKIAKDRNVALPGDLVRYTLTVKNSASFTFNNVRVTDVLPIGTVLDSVFLRNNATGNFDAAQLAEPTLATNPSATPYDAEGGLRTLTWTFPTLAAGEQHTMVFLVRLFWDLPADEIIGGIHYVREVRNTDYNARGVPNTGKKETVAFLQAPPPARTLLSGDAIAPPLLSLVKESAGAKPVDYVHYDGPGDSTTVLPGGLYSYRLSYSNGAGGAPGDRTIIHDEIPVGAEFAGVFKFNGVLMTNLDAITFYNESGHVIPRASGNLHADADGETLRDQSNKKVLTASEPFNDTNSNEKLDKGETFTDTNGSKKFDGLGSVRSFDIDLGALSGGSSGVFSYKVRADAKLVDGDEINSLAGGLVPDTTKSTAKVKAKRGYLMRSRNLSKPINGAPEFVTTFISAAPVNIRQARVEKYPLASASVTLPRQDEVGAGQQLRHIVRYSVTGGDAGTLLRGHAVFLTVAQGYTVESISLLDASDAPRAPIAGESGIGESVPGVNTFTTDKVGQRLYTVALGSLPGNPFDANRQGRFGALEVVLKVPDTLPVETKSSPGLVNAEGQALLPAYLSAQHAGAFKPPGSIPFAGATQRAKESTASESQFLQLPGTSTALTGTVNLDASYFLAPTPLKSEKTGSLFIGIGGPVQVQRGDLVTFTIFYGNYSVDTAHGAAGNCGLRVQIPFGTVFKGASTVTNFQGVSAQKNVRTESATLMPNASKPEFIEWDVLDFSRNSGGAVRFTVEVPKDYPLSSIKIDSAVFTARDANRTPVGASVSPYRPLVVHVRDTGLLASIGEAIGGFFKSLGGALRGSAKTALEAQAEALRQSDARTYKLGNAHWVSTTNGANIVQLLNDRVLVFGKASVIGALPEDIISDDGRGCVVAVGDSNSSILLNNLGGSQPGNYKPTDILFGLRDPVAGPVARGAVNVCIGGGGNLVGGDGASLIGNDGAAIATGVSLVPRSVGVVANDGAGVVSNDGAGVVSNDGAGVYPIAAGGGAIVAAGGGNFLDANGQFHLGSKLIGQDGAGIVAAGGGNIVAGGGGNIVAGGGGNILSTSLAGILANEKPKIVAGGGGNATSIEIFKGVTGIFDTNKANVLSHNGNALVNKPFDAGALLQGVRGQ